MAQHDTHTHILIDAFSLLSSLRSFPVSVSHYLESLTCTMVLIILVLSSSHKQHSYPSCFADQLGTAAGGRERLCQVYDLIRVEQLHGC